MCWIENLLHEACLLATCPPRNPITPDTGILSNPTSTTLTKPAPDGMHPRVVPVSVLRRESPPQHPDQGRIARYSDSDERSSKPGACRWHAANRPGLAPRTTRPGWGRQPAGNHGSPSQTWVAHHHVPDTPDTSQHRWVRKEGVKTL
jgi:hypothetical protein